MEGMGGGGMPTQQQVQKQQADAAAKEEQRAELLTKILSPEALQRIKTIAIVKEDKVRESAPIAAVVDCRRRSSHFACTPHACMLTPVTDRPLRSPLLPVGTEARGNVPDDGAEWSGQAGHYRLLPQANAREHHRAGG